MGPDVLWAEHANCTHDQSSSLSLDMWRDIAALQKKFRKSPASLRNVLQSSRDPKVTVAEALHAGVVKRMLTCNAFATKPASSPASGLLRNAAVPDYEKPSQWASPRTVRPFSIMKTMLLLIWLVEKLES